jgi:biopolymer transport protein ExbB
MMNFWAGPDLVLEYFALGGFVMWPLVLVAVALWYALVFRLLTIKSSTMNPRELIRKAKKKDLHTRSAAAKAACFAVGTWEQVSSHRQLKSIINEEFATVKSQLRRHKRLIRSLVAVAPLLGLLGTVDGMIETFDSLADMELFSQSGGIAGGISKALFTTQMGLAVSIPGLLMGRMLEQRELNICYELDQVRDLVCAEAKAK